MADLSGVLRKTIDGLPRVTPQLRAKVYDKARAAIQRQIQAANPPLDEAVSAARLAALEDAIERTEAHYVSQEGAGDDGGGAPTAPPATDRAPVPPPAAGRDFPQQSREPARTPPPAPELPRPPMTTPPVAASSSSAPPRSSQPGSAPVVSGERRGESPDARMPKATPPPGRGSANPSPPPAVSSERSWQASSEDYRSDWGQEARSSPLRPARSDAFAGKPKARSSGEVFPGFTAKTPARPRVGGADAPEQPFFPLASEEPEDEGRPTDVGAPFLTPTGNARREAAAEPGNRSGRWDDEGRRLPAGIRSDDDFIPEADLSAPRYTATRKRRSSGAGRRLATAAAIVLVLGGLGSAGWYYRDQIEALIMPPDGIDQIASEGSSGAVAPPKSETPPSANDTPAPNTPAENTQTAAAEPPASDSTRSFTQRLLPDGTEVDDGPAKAAPNAFDEGTNIAAASPVAPEAGATPTINSEVGQEPESVGGAPSPSPSTQDATPPEAATGIETGGNDAADTAALPVGQKAVFYQERTPDAAGTQESGNVVWSLVNEPPSDGQPPEPAIRATVDVPDENMSMTMTIRRNADPTLPASHVIELLFTTPANFAGGGIANVQRLALKATEQARGEPLIGVAGKISDGFFIIALNNLDQAEQSNLTLLKNQQWIDIPIAYATGRRALVSIEKGVPGDNVFKEAMDAWAAKT